MFQNIYCHKKDEIVYIWDDEKGISSYPFSAFRYAYRKNPNGEYMSLYGDKLQKVVDYSDVDPDLFESDLSLEFKALRDVYPTEEDIPKNHRVVVIDIEVDSEGGFPNMVEADKKLTSIALYDQLVNKYYAIVLDEDGKVNVGEHDNIITISCNSEQKLIETFLNKWNEINPTIVLSWNGIGFDYPYLYTRIMGVCGRKVVCRLSPINIVYQHVHNKKIIIGGISCLDYMDIYKKLIGTMKASYSLANVAKDEALKSQKLTYKGSLNDLYKTDLHRYIEYNITDVKIIVELDKKYDFLNLIIAVCTQSRVPYEWFSMSSRFIDGAILMYLRKHNLIANNRPVGGREMYEERNKDGEEGFAGAYVKEPVPGIYDWVYSVDITSLYPSVIMSLNISPETKLGKVENWEYPKFKSGTLGDVQLCDKIYSCEEFKKFVFDNNCTIASNGAVYKNDIMGVIPKILHVWFDERVQYRKLAGQYAKEGDKEKEAFYDRRQKRQKIFLNSLYGVTGLESFRFYDKDNAEATTLSGQTIIKSAAKYIDSVCNDIISKGNNDKEQVLDNIIYVDTDSLYLSSSKLANIEGVTKDKMMEYTINLSKDMEEKINEFYSGFVPAVFNISPDKNRIKIVSDVIAEKALWIAKKRYAMLKVYDMEKNSVVKDKTGRIGKLEVKGIDTVRSSYPFAFQKIVGTIMDMILRGEPKEVIDNKFTEYYNKINTNTIFELAKTTSVKFISQDENKNYNPSYRTKFQYVKGTPVGVKAALAHNDLIYAWGLVDKVEPIYHGQKIKWVYMLPNEFNIEQLAMKADDTDNDKIIDFITENIDRKKMYSRELKSKLEEIYKVIGWYLPSNANKLAEKTFDFTEEW